jgi:hypothetical protein
MLVYLSASNVGCGDSSSPGQKADAGQDAADAGGLDHDAAGADDADASDGQIASAPEPGHCMPKAGPDLDALMASGDAVMLTGVNPLLQQAFVYSDDFYFVADGIGLARVKSGSTDVEVLLSRSQSDQPAYVLVADDAIYFADADADPLSRVPLSDPSGTPDVQGGTPRGRPRLIQDGTLYGVDDDGSAAMPSLWKQDFESGAVVELASAKDLGDFDVAGGYAYFIDDYEEELYRVPTSGGQSERLTQGDFLEPQDVKVIGDKVYWADEHGMWVTSIDATDPKTSTEPFGEFGPSIFNNIAGSQRGGGFTQIGDRIYWMDDDGTVGWTSTDRKSCGSAVTLSSFDNLDAFGGGFIYADDDFNLYRITMPQGS